MKYIVFSDIHGSYHYAKIMQDLILKEQPDKIILLGDIYYHGPRNPLPQEYNPKEVCSLLNNYKDKIICIKGNCDAEVDEMISEFTFNEHISIEVNGKTIMLTHGHKFNIDNIPKFVDILMYGHFHTGFIKEKDGVICINPGSISLPKDNTPHSYVIIDEDMISLKDVDTHVIDSIKI